MNNPCKTCKWFEVWPGFSKIAGKDKGGCHFNPPHVELGFPDVYDDSFCSKYEGLAEAESRVKQREREIVGFYQSWHDTWIHTRDETKAEFLEKWGIPWHISFRRCLEAWLQGKRIREPLSVRFKDSEFADEAVSQWVRMPNGEIVVKTASGESLWFDKDGNHPKSTLVFEEITAQGKE